MRGEVWESHYTHWVIWSALCMFRNDGHPPGDADPLENAIRGIGYIPSNPQDYWDASLINSIKIKTQSDRYFIH